MPALKSQALLAAELAINEENVKRLLRRDRKELQAAGPGFAAEWDKPSDRGTQARPKQPEEADEAGSSSSSSSSNGVSSRADESSTASSSAPAASASRTTAPNTARQFGAPTLCSLCC